MIIAALAMAAHTAISAASLAPAGWDAGVKLPEARDLNPDPAIVEIALTARIADVEVVPGRVVHAWTYDGGIPGPLIRARVGDRVIVHFTNDLPQPTTVHWHGVRVPIEMDGVPGVSQPEMKRGDTFTYDFIVRDAGLYWYHPHVMSAAQVGFGLYGALLVEDAADAIGVADEITLVLSDIGFDGKGVLDSPESGGPAGMVFGREGAYILVNGRVMPTLRARAGAPQRWRIVNAAKSRFFSLDLEGQPFYVIGSDGGLIATPESTELLLITPGERADVIVTPTGPKGSELVMRAMLYNRGYGSVEYRNVEDVMKIVFTDQAPLSKPKMPAAGRAFASPKLSGATKVDVLLELPRAGPDGKSEFHVNGVPFWKARPYLAKVGETASSSCRSTRSSSRSIRWPGRTRSMCRWTAPFASPSSSTRPGMWMFHCHILDHADGGLMGHVHVAPDR